MTERPSGGFRDASVATMIAQYAMYAIGFIKIAIVSRLLEPHEIGVYTLAAALIFLAQTFRYIGTIEYLVTSDEASLSDRRCCFTIILIAAVLVTGAFLLSAEPLAVYFAMPELSGMLRVMVISFLILPIGGVVIPMMTRNMEFFTLSVIRTLATVADTVVVILLIYFEVGLISLAWGYVAANVLSTAAVILIAPRDLFYKPNLSGAARIFKFGVISASGTLINNLNFYLPTLVLGRAFDAGTVAYFGRGQAAITFFRQGIEVAVGQVTMSWFAKQSGDAKRSKAAFLRLMTASTGIGWPIYIFIVIHSSALIPLLFGPQWEQSIWIMQILALGAMFTPLSYAGLNVLTGRKKVGLRLRASLLTLVLRLAFLLAALPFGLSAAIVAVALGNVASAGIILPFLKSELGATLGDILRETAKSALLAGMVAGINLALLWGLTAGGIHSFAVLGVCALASTVIWFGGVRLLRHVLWDELLVLFRRARA